MKNRIHALAILLACGWAPLARATSVAPPSIPGLIGMSDAVLAGEVVAIEPDRLELGIPLFKFRKSEGV